VVPGLWRCGTNWFLGLGGGLLHPTGLLLLLGLWGVLRLTRRAGSAAFVARVFQLLLIESLMLAALSLGLALVVGHFRDATQGIEALQGLAVLVSWGTVGFLFWERRRAARMAGSDTRAQGARDSTRRMLFFPLVAIALCPLGLVFLVPGPIFGGSSLLSVSRFPGWVFKISTTELATDECLAVRALELPPPLFGWDPTPEPPDAPPHCSDFVPDLANVSGSELFRRGSSAEPAIARSLSRVRERGDKVELAHALSAVRQLPHGD